MAKQMKTAKTKIIETFQTVLNSRRRSDERSLSLSEVELEEWTSTYGAHVRNSLSNSLIEEQRPTHVSSHLNLDDKKKPSGEDVHSNDFKDHNEDTDDVKMKKSKRKKRKSKSKSKPKSKVFQNSREYDVSGTANTMLKDTMHGFTSTYTSQKEENGGKEEQKSNREISDLTTAVNSSESVNLKHGKIKIKTSKKIRIAKAHVKNEKVMLRKAKKSAAKEVDQNLLPDIPSKITKKQVKKERRKKKKEQSKLKIENSPQTVDIKEEINKCKSVGMTEGPIQVISSNNDISVINQLVLPNEEGFNSKVSSWFETSRFSDASDHESRDTRKKSRKHRKRDKMLQKQALITNDDDVSSKQILPALENCTEEFCQRFKRISELEIDNRKEILVLNMPKCDDDLQMMDEDIEYIFGNVVNFGEGSKLKDNQAENRIQDKTTNNTKNTTGDQIELSTTSTFTKKTKIWETNCKHTNDESELSKSEPSDKIPNEIWENVEDNRLKDDDDVLVVGNIQSGSTHCEAINTETLSEDQSRFMNQRQRTASQLRRIGLFNGILLEEELKHQIYLVKNKQEAEVWFTEMLDNVIKRLLDLHDQFRLKLDIVHQENMKQLDKDIRICKGVRKGALTLMEQPEEDQTSSTQCHDPNRSEDKVKEKCSVYEEILWRTYNSTVRFDYETVLHQKIQNLFFDSGTYDIFGQLQNRLHQTKRPTFILEGNMSLRPVNLVTGKSLSNLGKGLVSSVFHATGSACLPDGIMVLCDNKNSCLKVVNKENDVVNQKYLDSNPFDICVLGTKEIAVSVPEESKIFLFRYTDLDLSEVSNFETGSQCYGLATVNDTIVVACQSTEMGSSLQSFTKDGQLLGSFRNDHLGQPIFVKPESIARSEDETVLFVYDSSTQSTHCLTLTGCKIL